MERTKRSRSSSVLMVHLQTANSNSRSISPNSPTPARHGARLLRIITRTLGYRSNDDGRYQGEDDSRSSSSDSCSSTSQCSETKKQSCSSNSSGFRSASPHNPDLSSSGSDTGSESAGNRKSDSNRRGDSSTSLSLRNAFSRLNFSRSQSCSEKTTRRAKKSETSTPKRILRSPVSYTYVKGLSGLPTQRVPRKNSGYCCNSTQASAYR